MPDEPLVFSQMNLPAITKRFAEIVAILNSRGIIKSVSQLAEALDTHKQSLHEIVNGKRNLTLELASRVCEEFAVNPSFLLMGQLPKFVQADTSYKRDNISYIPVKVQAGYGEQISNPIFEAELEKFNLPGSQFQDDEYRCFEVEGESMYPHYLNGDKVICSPIPKIYLNQAIRDYMVYVVVTEHSLLLKRLVNKIKSEGCIELLSDNTLFDPKKLPITEVLEVWKVEGLITQRSFSVRKPEPPLN